MVMNEMMDFLKIIEKEGEGGGGQLAYSSNVMFVHAILQNAVH